MGLFGLHLPKKVNEIIGGVERQLNPFDNGQTYKQKTPVTNNSFIQQATHNGVTNFVGNTVVKPVARVPINLSNAIYNEAIAPTFNLPGQDLAHGHALNSFVGKSAKFTGATGSAHQTIGDIGTTALTLATGGAGKALEAGILKVAPKAFPAFGAKVGSQAAIGGGFLGSSGISEGHSAKDILTKDIPVGLATGAAFPVAGALVKPAAKGVVRVTKGASEAAKKYAAELDSKPFGVDAVNEAPQVRVRAGKTDPNAEVKSYVKKQIQAQKDATKGDSAGTLSDGKKGFKAKFVDTLSAIEDPIVQKKGRAGALELRDQLDRSLRARTIAESVARDEGYHDIVKGVKSTDEFNQYLIAKHARDLERNGVKTGRDLTKDNELVKALEPEYKAHAEKLQKYNHKLLDRAVGYGLIRKDTAAYLKKRYPNYVPFERIFTKEELDLQPGRGKGVANLSTQQVVRRIKGSEREIKNPLESVLNKTNEIVGQGERSRAARVVVREHKAINPLAVRELKSNETIGTTPTISFFDKGRKRTFEVPVSVAEAAKSLNQEQIGLIVHIMRYGTRVLRLGATGANAAFALANAAKDTLTAFINSEHSLVASPANPKVFVLAVRAAAHHGGDEYGEMLRMGATGTSFDIAREASAKSVKQIRAERNVPSKVLYTATHPGELLRAVEDTIGRTEDFNRAVQYFGNKQAALKEGQSLTKAQRYGADAARNNTVNFYRAGEYGRVLNSALPYLNAGIQGSRTFVRTMKERPQETSGKLVAAVFMPIAATTAWNLNDPKRKAAYDDISEYEKENNIIIIPPNPKQDDQGRWNVIKIPLSQEVSNLGSIVRSGIEQAKKDKNVDFKEVAGHLIGSGTSIQAQSPSQVIGQITPQTAKPGVETALNRNFFTGQQIVPDALQNLRPEDQVSKNTSGTARVIGAVTKTSPLKIDNAIRTATGGLGQNIINATDTALAKAGIIEPDQVKGKNLATSIAQRFNSAQGQTDGAKFFTTIQKKAKDQHLAGADYFQLNSIISKSLDADGNPRLLNDKDALEKNSILANSPNIAKVVADTAIELAKKKGKDVDPLYKLTPAQQNSYYKQQAIPYKSDDYEKIGRDNKSWLEPFYDARKAYFAKNPLPKNALSDKTPYPQFGIQTQNNMNKFFDITDGKEKAQYIQDHPDVQAALDELGVYTNKKRVAQGYTAFDAYPKAPPEVAEYNALPQGEGPNGKSPTRSAWIKAHPDAYAKVQNYFAAVAGYQVANNAGNAKYVDEDFNQAALKGIYSLGKYDIVKGADGNYSIDPQAASKANYSGYSGKKGYYRSGGSGGRRVRYRRVTTGKVRVRKGKGAKSKKFAAGTVKVRAIKSRV